MNHKKYINIGIDPYLNISGYVLYIITHNNIYTIIYMLMLVSMNSFY